MKRLLLTSVMAGIAAMTLSNEGHAAACLASDMSLTIGATTYAPTLCANGVNNGNPTQETANLNTAFGTAGFVYLDEKDAAGQTLSGISFVVTAPLINSGAWTVTWTDTNGAVPLNLPITIDFEIGLFGGNVGAGYFFDNVLLPVSPNSGTGTFDINFTNHGGQQPGLSHLTLTGGNAMHIDPPTLVPEPLSLVILGTGLLGIAFVRRRRTL